MSTQVVHRMPYEVNFHEQQSSGPDVNCEQPDITCSTYWLCHQLYIQCGWSRAQHVWEEKSGQGHLRRSKGEASRAKPAFGL